MHDGHRKTQLVFLALILLGSSSGFLVAGDQADKSPDKQVNKPLANVEENPKQLSVPPLDHVVYPESRPEWLGNPLQQSDGIATFVVVSGPCETREESLQELKLMRNAALSTFIQNVVGSSVAADFYQVSDKRFREDLTLRSYSGELKVGGTTQFEDAVEVRITELERASIMEAWKNSKVTQRLTVLGVVTVGGFMTLVASSSVFGIAIRRRERKKIRVVEIE